MKDASVSIPLSLNILKSKKVVIKKKPRLIFENPKKNYPLRV